MSYNGWENWDTWVVGLWASSDYALYQREVALMSAMLKYEESGTYDEDKARRGIIRYYRDVAIEARRHGDDADPSRINWEELIDAFLENYEEYKQYQGS